MNTMFRRVALAGALTVMAAPSAFAQLNRVGPVSPLGYPEWYQDKTGLTLEFCDSRTQAELEGPSFNDAVSQPVQLCAALREQDEANHVVPMEGESL